MAPPSVLAEIATEQQKVTAEIRELDLHVESTQTEVNRIKSREDQMKAKVEEIRRNPGNFQREEIFGATDEHAAAMARRMTMEGQLNSLQSKRKLIDRSAQILATAQRQLAEYTAPPLPPDTAPPLCADAHRQARGADRLLEHRPGSPLAVRRRGRDLPSDPGLARRAHRQGAGQRHRPRPPVEGRHARRAAPERRQRAAARRRAPIR